MVVVKMRHAGALPQPLKFRLELGFYVLLRPLLTVYYPRQRNSYDAKNAAALANEATGDFYAVSKLLDHLWPEVTLRYISQTTA